MADATEPTGKRGFLEELKRRHVWRVAVAYAIAAWLLVQIATQVFPFFNIPNWVVRVVVVLLAMGFPVAVAFAWVFELTPEGIRRTAPSDSPEARSELTHRDTGRKLNTLIMVVLVIAVALMGWRMLALRHDAAPNAPVTAATPAPPAVKPVAAAFNPPADTLVVLPFANESGDPKQQYFSDGITEELTNALGQNAALTVIAWDTASHYRNSSEGPQAIGKALNVANLLHGSIQREGDQVRVVVELVNTRTGAQVWSNHYDDSLANVFQVQDRISASIADALKVKFAAARSVQTVNPQAHDLVLQANALEEKALTAAPFEQAQKLYEQAIALAPDYADAHAGLAGTWVDLPQLSTLSLKEALPKAREEANKALALDPRNVRALAVLGIADASEGRYAEAKTYYQRALAIDPSNVYAHLDYAILLPLQQHQAQNLQAVQLDPDNAAAQGNLAGSEIELGEYAQALAPAQALMRLDPTSAGSALGLAQLYALLHRNADAVKAFDLAQPKTELAKALVAAGRLTYHSVLDPALHAQALAAVDALRRRTDLDPASMGDVFQLELALGQNQIALEQLPKFCAGFRVACSDLSINPVWLPLRGDPRFQALVKQYDTVSKPAAASASAAPTSTATSP
ncbi:MAG TPA: tetratricopeptide repeat protein [Rhodanobacteraceae bacterium]|nr:tetratricopeptide repeat protein [Rhodanobacteraceae bacterium]